MDRLPESAKAEAGRWPLRHRDLPAYDRTDEFTTSVDCLDGTAGFFRGMRRVWVRGHENVRKRVLIQAAACNIGLLLRHQAGIGTPRSLQGRAVPALCRLIGGIDRPLGASDARLGVQWTPTAFVGSIAHRQAA